MSENGTQAEKPTDGIERKQLIARTDARHEIGCDTTGATHFYSAHLGVVWVMDGDAIDHVERTRDLATWRAFVADRRGWEWHNISSDSLAETVANAFQEAV